MEGIAKVIEIQIGGGTLTKSLEEACYLYVQEMPERTKICFVVELPNGEHKQITIRDEDDQTVAYGDFEGLPNAIEYAKYVVGQE